MRMNYKKLEQETGFRPERYAQLARISPSMWRKVKDGGRNLSPNAHNCLMRGLAKRLNYSGKGALLEEAERLVEQFSQEMHMKYGPQEVSAC